MQAKNYQRLLAVDPSLTSSGWALFSLKDGTLAAVGVLSPPGPKLALSKRFDFLQDLVENLLDNLNFGVRDILVCEAPAPLVLNPQSALKVEGVRGIFEAVSRSRGVLVPGRLNPRTIQKELLGMRGQQLKRKQVKNWAREVARRLYGAELSRLMKKNFRLIGQDIIDAVLIGSLAVSRVKLAHRYGGDVYSAFVPKFKGGSSSRRAKPHGSHRLPRWEEKEYQQLVNKSRS